MPLGNELAKNAQVRRKIAPGQEAEYADQRPIQSTSSSTPILLENAETERGSEIERVRYRGSERNREDVKEEAGRREEDESL